jgi:hypothetical protein
MAPRVQRAARSRTRRPGLAWPAAVLALGGLASVARAGVVLSLPSLPSSPSGITSPAPTLREDLLACMRSQLEALPASALYGAPALPPTFASPFHLYPADDPGLGGAAPSMTFLTLELPLPESPPWSTWTRLDPQATRGVGGGEGPSLAPPRELTGLPVPLPTAVWSGLIGLAVLGVRGAGRRHRRRSLENQ